MIPWDGSDKSQAREGPRVNECGEAKSVIDQSERMWVREMSEGVGV